MATRSKIERHLKKLRLEYKLIDLGGEHFRVEDVIKFGVKPDKIVKTLLVRANPKFESLVGVDKGVISLQKLSKFLKKHQYFAFGIRGKDRLSFKKVKKLLGPSAELARAEEVLKVVGVPVGAVCPIEIGVPVYFDKKVFQTFLRSSSDNNRTAGLKRILDLKNVNLGSGDLTCGLDMTFSDLLKAVGKWEIADVA